VIGPLLIFDKSFLEMLNPEEVSELSIHFKFVGTPTLIGEIIADLKLEPSKKRVPIDVVRALSAKMQEAHGLQPANFRKLAVANICAHEIRMAGQVPVDASAPNVRVSADGKGVLYDSTPEQRLWARWASGTFDTDDVETATIWRNGIEQIDLPAVAMVWKEFASQHFGAARDQDELISGVDAMLRDPDPAAQRNVLGMTLDFVGAPQGVRRFAFALMAIREMRSVLEFAPYAASLIRLFLSFVCGLARGFIGPRPTNYIDLQYLFYAPFCMVFVSNDKFHRQMWPAVSGVNTFLWGQDLKDDLRRRVEVRRGLTESEPRAVSGAERSSAAEPSVISEAWRRYMRPAEARGSASRAKTIDDLEPEIQQQFREAMRQFDKMDRQG
jgi:hypothetical protein